MVACQAKYATAPCTKDVTTRWIKVTCKSIELTSPKMDDGTGRVVIAALGKITGDIRDVKVMDYVAGNGGVCNTNRNTIGRHVAYAGACWVNSHPHEGNVYDFTHWTLFHPGNKIFQDKSLPNPIVRFAEAGSTQMYFPGTHAQSRWDTETKGNSRHNSFHLVGKVGDTIDFATLHPDLQTAEVATKVGAKSTFADIGFEACGSRGEVGSNPLLGNHYLWLENDYLQGIDYRISDNDAKAGTWATVVTQGKDQLRQRVAWSLSQILVTGLFGALDQEHELWSTYYDIFVYNAFGNYRDILREVSASPLMAKYLTFLNNKAQAITNKFPDENYAREIMQLFSIGLYKLNMDGTQKLDAKTGQPLITYSNDDIMAFAKVWVSDLRASGAWGI